MNCIQVVCEGFSITKQVQTKECATDLVTEFDQRVEEILIKKLQEKFPTHKLVKNEIRRILLNRFQIYWRRINCSGD